MLEVGLEDPVTDVVGTTDLVTVTELAPELPAVLAPELPAVLTSEPPAERVPVLTGFPPGLEAEPTTGVPTEPPAAVVPDGGDTTVELPGGETPGLPGGGKELTGRRTGV